MDIIAKAKHSGSYPHNVKLMNLSSLYVYVFFIRVKRLINFNLCIVNHFPPNIQCAQL